MQRIGDGTNEPIPIALALHGMIQTLPWLWRPLITRKFPSVASVLRMFDEMFACSFECIEVRVSIAYMYVLVLLVMMINKCFLTFFRLDFQLQVPLDWNSDWKAQHAILPVLCLLGVYHAHYQHCFADWRYCITMRMTARQMSLDGWTHWKEQQAELFLLFMLPVSASDSRRLLVNKLVEESQSWSSRG